MKLDVRGEICPYPVQMVVEALDRLPVGEELEILTDHPPSLEMVRAIAGQRGFAMRLEDAGPGEWRIILAKKEGRLQ
jgi:tRNA 2-thiouridine synthesizing protein A